MVVVTAGSTRLQFSDVNTDFSHEDKDQVSAVKDKDKDFGFKDKTSTS